MRWLALPTTTAEPRCAIPAIKVVKWRIYSPCEYSTPNMSDSTQSETGEWTRSSSDASTGSTAPVSRAISVSSSWS